MIEGELLSWEPLSELMVAEAARCESLVNVTWEDCGQSFRLRRSTFT